jgi:hypothetical protein
MRSRGVDGAIFRSSVTTAGGSADWPKAVVRERWVEVVRGGRASSSVQSQDNDYLRLSASGVRRWYGATTRDAICKRPRHALSDGAASKGDTGSVAKKGRGGAAE